MLKITHFFYTLFFLTFDCMIDKAKVWNRVRNLARTVTTGYDDQEEYNSKTYAAELSLLEMLTDVYEHNTKASDALDWLITDVSLTSDSAGKLTLPADYVHLATIQYVGNGAKYPTTKVRTNEVAMYRTSPVRGFSVAKNDIGYYFKASHIYTIPEQAAINVVLTYIKKPTFSSIVLTEVSTGTEDYLSLTGGVDFGWPEQLFNLIVYLILEQLGVELKEEWLLEFAAYGITREVVKV